MNNLCLVAAIGKNNELGLDNHLLWKIKEDLQFYKKLTMHQNIIMGRKTFESMPPKALEGRTVFVLSSKSLDKYYDINSFNSVDSLVEYAKRYNHLNFIVVGGSQIYEQFLPYVDIMYLTEIDDYAAADTFFPHFDIEDWDIETIYYNINNYMVDNNINYIRNKYTRKRVK